MKDSDKGKVSYPADHKPGMEVPRGGSMCKNCKYLEDADKKLCGEPNFVEWNGSPVIPGEIDAYCSDWWQPRKVKPLGRDEARDMTFAEILDTERPAAEEK